MAASTITTSVVTGGTNSHATTVADVKGMATDIMSQGVVGSFTANTGSGGTGSFCVNAQGSPTMAVDIKAGQAWITATPSGQVSQKLRAYMASDYTGYTISANSSGSTKYDWIYLSVNATNANNPASDASDVTSIYTSRSSSNSTDNGSPPTYGKLLAIVTVANGASSITNSNITDKRVRALPHGGINDSNDNEEIRIVATASAVNDITVTNAATGNAPSISASGDDTNIALKLSGKGTGAIQMYVNGVNQMGSWQTWTPTLSGWAATPTVAYAQYLQVGKIVYYRIQVSGTSNATTTTFTLPVATTSNYNNQAFLSDCVDNTFNKLGTYTYASSSTTVTAYVVTGFTSPFGAWTSSGTKGIDVTHFYEVA